MGNKEKCLYIYFLSGQKIAKIYKRKHNKKILSAITYIYPNIFFGNCGAILVGDEIKLARELDKI